MHQSVQNALYDFLKQYEGKVNFMYLDVKGLVTVGVGHLIDPVNMATKLEFRTKGGGGAVSAGEVAAEWQTVKARKDLMQKGAAAFDAITHLELSDNGIRAMVKSSAAAIEDYIKNNASAKKFYSDFDNWPADAQLAFMGVAWGGIPIPQFGWHKFPEACRVEDWDAAAVECKISSPIAAGRNEAHKMMFLNAAAVKANGDNISELSWPNRRGKTVTQ
jgi:GH24 family phage-related lysozyme (muramidase)